MLQPGARDDGGVAMLVRQLGKARDGAIEIRQQRIEQRGESSAHDARDLTILFRLCQSQSPDPEPPTSPLRLRICIARRPMSPFLLGLACFTWGNEAKRPRRRPWP